MPVTRPLLSCSSRFNPPYTPLDNPVPKCPSFLHNLYFVQLEKSCSLLAHTVHILRCLNLYNSQLHLSLPLSFSAPRCSCLFIQLRLSWRRTVRSGSNFSALQPSHWVDVCFEFWRCRPHRIFMWETQTYSELIGSGGADTHTDPLSHFSFFLPA